LNIALLCSIYGVTVENSLFEDGYGANISCAFNPTQAFFSFKKKIVIDLLSSASHYPSYYIIT
jgi:hypothetical protein